MSRIVILRASISIQKLKKKKTGSNAMMGDFPLGLFVYVYLIGNKIGTEEAQTHLQKVVLQP